MTPSALLRQLSALSHGDRMRRLVELGRESRSDAKLAAALAPLEQGSFHERLWSLQSCFGSRDIDRVVRGLGDPSRQLRRRAVRLLLLVGDDAAIGRALTDLSRRPLIAALGRLRRAGRFGPIDAHLDELARRDDRALELLLPYGSEKALDRHLATAAAGGGLVFFARLARLHPLRAAELLRGRLGGARRLDPELTRLASAVLPSLAKRDPDSALTLVGELARVTPLTTLSLHLILRRRPLAVAEFVLRTRGHRIAHGFFNEAASRLPKATVLELAEHKLVNLAATPSWYGRRPYRWLERLAPELRGELYELLRGPKMTGAVAPDLLAVLPAATRRREAVRCMGLKKYATKPAQRLAYVAFLDWDEALAAVEPQLTHPDGVNRALALASLGGIVKYQRNRATDYLALVRARKHEQDPVRLAMVTALANVPPSVWGSQHGDDLGGVIREALDARDLSEGTAGWLSWLVLRQLPRHPDWAAGWLTTLVRERGRVNWHKLDKLLTDDDVRKAGPALLPVLKSWRKKERDLQLLQLAQALGRRLGVFPQLIDLLETLARSTKESYHAGNAIALLNVHARARMPDLVPRLLREDPSWIVHTPVWQHVHRHRQDLLTPFLGQKAVKGRFDTGKNRLLLPIPDGFARWNPEQSQTFSNTLKKVIRDADPEQDSFTILDALRRLAAMPGVAPDVLIEQASGKERPAIRDTALSLLGGLDDDAGIPTLLEALGDERARVAVYALRKELIRMPAAHALGLLRQAPLKKVTVAKEVVRLVGEMAGDDAFDFLREMDGRKLHRDVRAAVLRAVWTHLEREESWSLIDRAVESGDPALMHAVVRIPSDRLSVQTKRRLVALLAALLDHPNAEVRLAVLQRCYEQPANDPDRTLFAKVVESIGSPIPDLRRSAAWAMRVGLIGEDADRLATAARTLASDRRAISELVTSLGLALCGQKTRLGGVGRAVMEALADDPILAALRMRLALATLSAKQFTEYLVEQDRAGWRADLIQDAIGIVGSPGSSLQTRELRALEDAFASSSSPVLRRLALAALTAQGVNGWDEKKLARLDRFRADRDALVAAAAQFTFAEDEDEDEDGEY